MGFDEGRIILDKASGVYNVGEVIKAKIVFDQERPQHVIEIRVHWTGFCKVQWTKSKKNYEGYEEYINNEFYIFGVGEGSHELPKGHHEISFDCPIPSTCPSSFEGKFGHIRYQIKVIMVTPRTTSEVKPADIIVYAPMDINQNPHCKEPIENREEHSIMKWCCFKSGYLKMMISIEKGGYMPGDTIPVVLNAENRSDANMTSIAVGLKKVTKYTAKSEAGIKEDIELLTLNHDLRKIKPRTKYYQQADVFVPEMETHNLMGCQLIAIEYIVQVVVTTDSIQLDFSHETPIIIGSLPKEPQENGQHLHSEQQLPNSTCQGNFFQIVPYPTPSNMH